MSASKLKNEISVMLLEEPMSLKEIAQEMDIKEKKSYSLLKSMFNDERVMSFKDVDGERRYKLTEEETEKAIKRKERAEKKASKKT
jgi:predicted transcriptional regulator